MKRNTINTFIKYYTKGLLVFLVNELILLFSKEIILVYTMAKVGSTTYYKALKTNLFKPVFHIHSLNWENEKKVNQELRQKKLYPDSWSNTKRILKHIKRGKKTKVITSIRDPLSRNLSAFFEVLEYYTEGKGLDMDIEELTTLFLEKLPHEYPLNWLDEELKPYLNIDVYQYPFDTTKKYQVIKNKAIELLMFRLDASDKDKKEQLSIFMNNEIFELKSYNTAKKKYYAVLYKKFRETVILPPEYIHQLMNHKLTQHFYNQKECEEMRFYWNKKNV